MATDFFDQQHRARKRTGLLVGYFAVAVLAIVLAVYGAVTLILLASAKDGPSRLRPWDWQRLGGVAVVVGLVIVSGSLYKIATLREGGGAVARLLGGEVVNPGSATPAERRLLNVVEEMAIASGTAVPTVYVLADEPSINAFAAGHEPGDAVIAVNRGTLDHLSRDELQGVIAHEFSHILNGDMRLNLQLIGLLHGILLIALVGELLVRILANSSSSNRSRRSKSEGKQDGLAMALFLLGVALVAIGWLGVFFGRLIKSAISRQREFLADASAVQFTRNPGGIVGALKKIGGLASHSRIASPNAEQASHMFFGPGLHFVFEALSTHPPLAERIRRLDPSFDGTFPSIEATDIVEVSADEEPARDRTWGLGAQGRRAAASTAEIPLDPGAAVASVGAPRREHVEFATALLGSLPDPLTAAAREPFGARAVIYALLLDRSEPIRRRQLQILETGSAPGTAAEVLRVAPWVDSLDEAARLPLADLAIPALRQLSPGQYRAFRDQVEPLVQADRTVSLFEFALQRMLLRHLDQHFEQRPSPPARYRSLGPLLDACSVLLSALAQAGQSREQDASRAFFRGGRELDLAEGLLTERPAEACSLEAVDRALGDLALASPPLKRRILSACAACIAADGLVTVAEGELLRAVADSLDCPMPPLLSGSSSSSPAAPGLRGAATA